MDAGQLQNGISSYELAKAINRLGMSG
jgi:hypothetical protein